MRHIINIFILIITCSLNIKAQTGEGGGVYIRNNGQLIGSIVTNNYAVNGFCCWRIWRCRKLHRQR